MSLPSENWWLKVRCNRYKYFDRSNRVKTHENWAQLHIWALRLESDLSQELENEQNDHQYAAPLEHVGPVEDGLLVVVMLERDHKRRPASDLGPDDATLEPKYGIIACSSYLVGVSLKMLTSMISLRMPSLVRTMSAMMLARDSMLSPSYSLKNYVVEMGK